MKPTPIKYKIGPGDKDSPFDVGTILDAVLLISGDDCDLICVTPKNVPENVPCIWFAKKSTYKDYWVKSNFDWTNISRATAKKLNIL
jgi:hypothetical protein